MPEFVYVGEDGMFYPDLSLSPARGDAVELVRCPTDGRWVPAASAASAASAAPAAPAAPRAASPASDQPLAAPLAAPLATPAAPPAAPDTEIK